MRGYSGALGAKRQKPKTMQNSNRTGVPVIVFLAALFGSGFVPRAHALYVFTKIADTNLFVFFHANPSINESGDVAFQAITRSGETGIFTASGEKSDLSEYTTIVLQKPGSPSLASIGSYRGSRVAFSILDPLNRTTSFIHSDGINPVVILTDAGNNISKPFHQPVWMNNLFQVAYVGGNASLDDFGLRIAHNGSSVAVYKKPRNSILNGPPHLASISDGHNPQVKDSGAIFFYGEFSNSPSIPPIEPFKSSGVLETVGGEPQPTEIVHDGVVLLNDGENSRVTNIEAFSANDRGEVLALETVSENGEVVRRLVVGTRIVTDTKSGPFIALPGNFNDSQRAINNSGTLLFLALFKDGAGVTQQGLFTGTDLINDKVLVTGDALLDSKVVAIDFSDIGFNNKGQIALRVFLTNGYTAIVRADPTDGGTVVDWVPKQGGAFTDASNWKPANGDAPRVPTKTADIVDTARFPNCAFLPIDVGTQHFERLLINCGDLTFRQGDVTLAGLSDISPSLEITGGSLTLEGTILRSSHAWIGNIRQGRLTVPDGSTWSSQGRVEIGKDGTGKLEVRDIVQSAETRIGNGRGEGEATVEGPVGFWATGNLAVGYDAKGTLSITDAGHVKSESAFIGFLHGAEGNVTVFSEGRDAQWDVSKKLTVGQAGFGMLTVQQHATVFATNETVAIGNSPAGNGVVRVFTGSLNGSTALARLVTEFLTVGQSGRGELQVGGGSAFVASLRGMTVGENGLGIVTVNGAHAPADESFAILTSFGFLSIGDGPGTGSISIENGGNLSCSASASMGLDNPQGRALVIVDGADSQFNVGTDLDAGQNGFSTIGLNGSTVTVNGTLSLHSHGELNGAGTVATGMFKNEGTVTAGISLASIQPHIREAKTVQNKPKAASSREGMNTLTITGAYEQTARGRVVLQIGGTNLADYSHLTLSNSAALGGTLEFRFVNGFAPKRGDAFNFLQVKGDVTGGFATLEVKNLDPDFQFNIATNGANLSLVTMNDGIFSPPLQGQIASSNVVTMGGISYLPYTLALTNPCSVVATIGSTKRQGQELFQTLSERVDPNCNANNTAERILPLGPLTPGRYQFHFMADGVTVHTASFEVPTDASQVLTFTRTAGGELNLQIHGLPSVLYTIQSSRNLNEWFDLPAHVGTFLGPYDILEPFESSAARFYRVKIE